MTELNQDKVSGETETEELGQLQVEGDGYDLAQTQRENKSVSNDKDQQQSEQQHGEVLGVEQVPAQIEDKVGVIKVEVGGEVLAMEGQQEQKSEEEGVGEVVDSLQIGSEGLALTGQQQQSLAEQFIVHVLTKKDRQEDVMFQGQPQDAQAGNTNQQELFQDVQAGNNNQQEQFQQVHTQLADQQNKSNFVGVGINSNEGNYLNNNEVMDQPITTSCIPSNVNHLRQFTETEIIVAGDRQRTSTVKER
eukprot:TRINITY_DN12155_c0_g1_i1.p1 TRINITY_DN12155_c0_g1~~TRINITY_DN12155_c0_g1_i1.p1  ORF type:complete len:248 (-),score=45.89 TRINITY_DN12155_c0_g1_i1:30-773(-)